MNNFIKISKSKKITYLIIIMFFIIILSIGIPSLARYKNRIITDISVWDGNIATSYKKGDGSKENPYVISNGAELAYFSNSLKTNNYENQYFILENDIILNNGTFKYENDKITYTLDNIDYYVKENSYYASEDFSTEANLLNMLESLNNFKGHLDGKYYTIYGLYINQEEASLFINLEGNISNLYFKNCLLIGDNASLINNATNANISSILLEGYIVSDGKDKIKTDSFIIDNILVSNIEKSEVIKIPHNLSNVNLFNIKISGDYEINNNGIVKINDNVLDNNHFELILDTDELNISTSADSETTLTFSNLVYEIIYKDNIASGIVGSSNNTKIKNVINKGNIYSNNFSSGLVGILENSEIINSYNIGNVNTLGALVAIVSGNSNLINVYNTCENIGLINKVIDATVNIDNSFNTSNVKVIKENTNSLITVNNSYVINSSLDITNSFIVTTINNLKNKEFMESSYKEFVSFDDIEINPNNVWVYEDDNYPLLYNDDINNPFINLHVKTYTFSSYSNELETLKFTENITFSIEDVDSLVSSDKYYYISNSKTPLSKQDLETVDWINYNNIEVISDEGFYVIYVKATDGTNTYYANSDLLVLDLSGSNVNVSLKDKTWNNLRDNLEYNYINEQANITIEAIDELSGIKSIEYFISSNLLSNDELENLSWITYNDEIIIDTVGKYIIYVKVVDNSNYVTYVNTDYIVYNGYSLSISSGNHKENNLNITNKSKIFMNFSYESEDNVSGIHYLKSNVLLPKGTKILVKDNLKNKIYEYKIITDEDLFGYNTSCTLENCEKLANYSFELFKEKNKIEDNNYVEESLINKENIDIILDFEDSIIESNIENIKVYLEIVNSSPVRPTLKDNIKTFNIYINKNADLSLSTNYSGENIIYNSDSTTNIDITSGIVYQYINSNKINDTTYEDKNQGLAIKLLDSDDKILGESYLKNMKFEIDGTSYSPDTDNIIRIPFSNDINKITKTLKITTLTNSSNLKSGIYNIEISNFASYDGLYYDTLNNSVRIPVSIISNNTITDQYSFDVTMNENSRIIPKNNSNVLIDFDITALGLTNPSIRISLYKKDILTAYNQDYSIVNLMDYTNTVLDNVSTNVYNIPLTSTFTIDLNTNNFENTGYKFVFELYDNNRKISSIDKYFIVR